MKTVVIRRKSTYIVILDDRIYGTRPMHAAIACMVSDAGKPPFLRELVNAGPSVIGGMSKSIDDSWTSRARASTWSRPLISGNISVVVHEVRCRGHFGAWAHVRRLRQAWGTMVGLAGFIGHACEFFAAVCLVA